MNFKRYNENIKNGIFNYIFCVDLCNTANDFTNFFFIAITRDGQDTRKRVLSKYKIQATIDIRHYNRFTDDIFIVVTTCYLLNIINPKKIIERRK